MGNENDIQEAEETLELPEVAESEEDATDWRAEAKKLQEKAIRQREKTKELKARLAELEAQAPKKEEIKKPSEFDYGQKAFLKTYGIDGADERELARTWMERTGDDLDKMVTDEIFTARLTALREAKASKEAMPSSTKRAVVTERNSTDYWLAQYEQGKSLNEIPMEYRRDVLNARIKKDEQKTKFGS
jgi:hypothetical protein